MLGVKLVAKLYDVPSSDGHVTAFDAHGTDVYIGTDKGLVQKFNVTIEHPNGDEGDTKIFTTLLKSQQVSKNDKKIARLQHSPAASGSEILFLLTSKTLFIYDSTTLTVLQEVATGIGAFTASIVRAQKHVICASERFGKAIHVYSYDAATRSEPPRHIQELLLPESVQALVEHNGILCVGLRREYSLLSIADGDAKSLLALNGHDPLLALGDGEVYLRLHNAVFVVSIRAMPTGKGSVLKRTVRFESEPQCIAVQHPYLFAFTDSACDVYCTYEDEVIERLPVQGCLLAASPRTVTSSTSTGTALFFCSKSRLWMLQTHPLRAQLEDLVARYKIEDAFHLLHSQPPSEELRSAEVELNIMAGFAHLYHNAPMLAMRHFNEHLDVREILSHVPDLVPPRSSSAAAGAESGSGSGDAADDAAFWAAWSVRHRHNRHSRDIEAQWRRVFEELPLVDGDATLRLVDGVKMDLATYLHAAWDALRRALVLWLRSLAATASHDQRRCIEFALLALYLGFGDHRSLFRLITMESALCLRDCESLLRERRQWRLLMALCARKGDAAAVARLFDEHLDVTRRPGVAGAKFPAELQVQLIPCSSPALAAPSPTAELVQVEEPSNVHEIFFAIESHSLKYVAAVLREDPRALLVTDLTGSAALHHACSLSDQHNPAGGSGADHTNETQRKMAIVSFLVDCGAHPTAPNRSGQTPLDIAFGAGGADADLIVGAMLGALRVRVLCQDFVAHRVSERIPPAKIRYGTTGAPSPAAGSWTGLVATK